MPKTAYERKVAPILEHSSTDSVSTVYSDYVADIETEKLKEFYQSIPDYKDINHLTTDEFYITLKSLRHKKNKMLNQDISNVGDNYTPFDFDDDSAIPIEKNNIPKQHKTRILNKGRRKCSIEIPMRRNESKPNLSNRETLLINKVMECDKSIFKSKNKNESEYKNSLLENTVEKIEQNQFADKNELKTKRNHSACSISWSESCKVDKDQADTKLDNDFVSKCYEVDNSKSRNKSQSMPSSPIRTKRFMSPCLSRRKSITIPKPFKMTERDEDERTVSRLRKIQKSFSDDMLNQKCERSQFRARLVPIESRIPLYDRILEDQAMRRAITKINSEAELRASMKPFSFTKREENCSRATLCERSAQIVPKCKKKKRFRARPVPKNLFSNYIYDKMREDEFFRCLNRRIRAEELLKRASVPSNMAARESRLSTPAAHSDLPTDPSPIAPSVTPSDRPRTRSPTKDKKRERSATKGDFITTSPQPFKFNTAERAAKKTLEAAKKIYQENPKRSSSGYDSGRGARVYSALELRAHESGRSNLAALLRVENVKRRMDVEATNRLAEQRRQIELRSRDRLLRSKPAWHLVKNNHEQDIAMRLQTRRDEERMRREEFLHEMELMYGRVQQQPLLFERYYAPRSHSEPADSIQLSPRKIDKRRISRKLSRNYHFNTPSHSRKASINGMTDAFHGLVSDYLTRADNEKLYSDSG